ncbi:uncharacterized protein ALTATR162_LOCUS8311 [Alternaria atra]|uniref:Uncharacterized protein n=1 Tax=Alternaria atra TaxID=119953 RepID=A0A8J2I5L3_9PLEO|nr:uncharacterized protein ALTATR162_LOCUS8311 [Alternaria atra]CAG5177610.1 unnamed protein product [Alternaria atra]
MRFSVAVSALFVLMGSFVNADLHKEGLCIDKIGGQYVYNADATKKACDAYLQRNTGDKQWDKCPDCKMTEVGKLNLCQSLENHIGGDELNYYCTQNGASDSLAS